MVAMVETEREREIHVVDMVETETERNTCGCYGGDRDRERHM